jgi:hypothetical protein
MREWVEETYPALRERARSEGAGVLFGDQVRGALRPARRAHLGSQGPDTDRGADRNRFGLSAMSTISTRGELHFTVLNQSFNAEVFIAFLHRLLGQFEEEIHLVVDGHPAHRAKKVVDWVARRPDQIELHFLPAYAPHVNPDELVNADLKRALAAQRSSPIGPRWSARSAPSSTVSRNSRPGCSAIFWRRMRSTPAPPSRFASLHMENGSSRFPRRVTTSQPRAVRLLPRPIASADMWPGRCPGRRALCRGVALCWAQPW